MFKIVLLWSLLNISSTPPTTQLKDEIIKLKTQIKAMQTEIDSLKKQLTELKIYTQDIRHYFIQINKSLHNISNANQSSSTISQAPSNIDNQESNRKHKLRTKPQIRTQAYKHTPSGLKKTLPVNKRLKKIDKRWYVTPLTIVSSSSGGSDVFGTVYNKSKRPYSYLALKLNIYNRKGKLIESCPIGIRNIPPMGKKDFETFLDTPKRKIGTCKLKFEWDEKAKE